MGTSSLQISLSFYVRFADCFHCMFIVHLFISVFPWSCFQCTSPRLSLHARGYGHGGCCVLRIRSKKHSDANDHSRFETGSCGVHFIPAQNAPDVLSSKSDDLILAIARAITRVTLSPPIIPPSAVIIFTVPEIATNNKHRHK